MPNDPQISNEELVEGWRVVHGDVPVRVVRRRRLRPTAGLTGSYFERVRLEADGRKIDAILKQAGLAFGPATRERLFFAELAHEVPVRAPRCYAVAAEGDGDGWVLMERLPKGKLLVDWSDEETRTSLRNLASLHARYLGQAPASLPRPFTDDIEHSLSFLPEGVRKLRERYEELPHLPRTASERTFELVLQLAAQPEILRQEFARSPETLLHGDFHRGNLIARDGEPQVLFDWQFVCAGPPAYDLAIFWLYLGAVNKPGFFGFFDRVELRERTMTWDEVVGVYGEALLRERPDADIDAITSCADAAIAWETVRQLTYQGHGMEPFMAILRFVHRDHPRIGGAIARWLGIDQMEPLYNDVFRDFERRAERLIRQHEQRGAAPAGERG